MEEATVRPKRLCVRINDKQNMDYKLYKNNIPDELERERYRFSAKYAEQVARGCSPTSVARRKRFQPFQTDSEGLEPKTLPEGYHSFSRKKKQETVKNLIEEIAEELTAAAMSRAPVQGVDIQADSSNNLQVGAGSARQLDMTVREDVDMQVNNPGQIQVDELPAGAPNSDLGNKLSNEFFSPKKKQETVKKLVDEIADELAAAAMIRAPVQGVEIQADSSKNLQVGSGSACQLDMTVHLKVSPNLGQDVDMQVNNPGEIQIDEVPAGAPNPGLRNTLSNDASFQGVAWNQRDPLPVDDLVLILSDIKRRSLGFPESLPKFEWSEEAFRSYITRLEFLEGAPLEEDFKHSIYE